MTTTVTTGTSPTEATSQPEPQDWSQVVKQARGAVVRLSVTECVGDPTMGTGFLVDDNLVMTAAHVVMKARTVTAQTDDGAFLVGEVVGLDSGADAALIRIYRKTLADPLLIAAEDPDQGSALAVLGYPLATHELNVSTGIVSGRGEPVDYGDQRVEHVFLTDAATNGGNSGGPVVNRAGKVIGLVSGGTNWDSYDVDSRRPVQGINYIVPASELAPRLDQWRTRPSVGSSCPDETRPRPVADKNLQVRVSSGHVDARDIALTLFTHGQSINVGAYAAAWSLFTPREQTKLRSRDQWSSGLASSYWEEIEITKVGRVGAKATAEAALWTEQDAVDGPQGQTCTIWLLTYDMEVVDGQWLIDKARKRADSSPC